MSEKAFTFISTGSLSKCLQQARGAKAGSQQLSAALPCGRPESTHLNRHPCLPGSALESSWSPELVNMGHRHPNCQVKHPPLISYRISLKHLNC